MEKKMLFINATNLFIQHCQAVMNLSDHTLRAYTSDLKKADNFWLERKKITKIKKEDLRDYIFHQRDKCQLKESSIKRRIASLKLLFKWAHTEHLIAANPFDELHEKIRLPGRLPRALDKRDSNRLKAAIYQIKKSDNIETACKKIAIHLLLETGIRVSELTSIQISDISISDQSIKIKGKGNRQRLVYFLSSDLKISIQNYLKKRLRFSSDDTLLFIKTKKNITPPHVRLWLKVIASEAKIKQRVTPHMLRHTCATQWLEAGLDIRYVQKLLGHHSISTTEIYTHVSDQGLRKALMKANRR
jgi:site-specific recombinase XerD